MIPKYSKQWLVALSAATLVLSGSVVSAQPKVYPTDVVHVAAAANGARVVGST